MNKIKVMSLLLAVAMFCALFTGCGSSTVMKINGTEISKDVYAGAIGYTYSSINMQYQQYGMDLSTMLGEDRGDGKTIAEDIKEEAEQMFISMEAIRQFAKDEGIELTKELEKEVEEVKKQQIESDGGKKAFIDNLKEMKVTEEFFDYFIEAQVINAKASELFAEGGKYALGKDKIIESAKADFVRVKHVLVLATEGDADYAEKKATAESVLARAKAGEDFDALIAEYGEDPGMETYADGYVMDKDGVTIDGTGPMETAFTEASHALAENGVSDIVPSSHGFHIIKRYPMDDAYFEANFDQFEYNYVNVAYSEKIGELVEKMKTEKTEHYAKLDIYDILGVEKTVGANTAEASHEGHDHE